MLELSFTPQGWEDYQYWLGQDKKTFKRINALIKECMRTPFEGMGKPEGLKHSLAGCWSRRIDQCHRLVYKVDGNRLIIFQARWHY